jgi:hypothetical protein
MPDRMTAKADKLTFLVPQHPGGRRINKNMFTFNVQTQNALSG